MKFKNVEKDRKYVAITDFGIFKKGDKVYVDTVRNLGTEVVLELKNKDGKNDSIKGDLEEEVEVFDNSLNNESINQLKEALKSEIRKILNSGNLNESLYDDIKSTIENIELDNYQRSKDNYEDYQEAEFDVDWFEYVVVEFTFSFE